LPFAVRRFTLGLTALSKLANFSHQANRPVHSKNYLQ